MADISVQERFHPGTVGFAAVFDDADGEGKEPAHMESFVKELMEVGERHGFKLKNWGNSRNVQRLWARQMLIGIVDSLVASTEADDVSGD